MQAIGFTSVASGIVPGAAASVLEAQLNRYQAQLADWCNCPSGKTPAGKEKIKDLQTQVDTVKAQLERVAKSQAQGPSAADRVSGSPNPGTDANGTLPNRGSADNLPPSTATRFAGALLGGLVDAFA